MAGTVGAGQVAELAGLLEQDCRLRVSASAQLSLSRLSGPLQGLTAALSAQGLGDEAPSVAAAGAEADADWLPRLRRMLASCDSEALALWQHCRAEAERLLGRAAARRIGNALDQL